MEHNLEELPVLVHDHSGALHCIPAIDLVPATAITHDDNPPSGTNIGSTAEISSSRSLHIDDFLTV